MKNTSALRLAASLGSLLALSATGACASHEVPVIDPQLSPALEVRANELAHAAIPNGTRSSDVLVGLASRPGEGTSWGVPLELGRCYAFGIASDLDVARLQFTIWSPTNKRVFSERWKTGQGVLNYCPPMNGIFRLETKVPAGAGHFVAVTYASPAVAAAPPPVVAAPAAPVVVIVH